MTSAVGGVVPMGGQTLTGAEVEVPHRLTLIQELRGYTALNKGAVVLRMWVDIHQHFLLLLKTRDPPPLLHSIQQES